MIEGNDDTAFRIYRESNPAGLHRTWWSVAGSIDELKALADKLENYDRGPKARSLAKRISNSIPRFEATEEVGLGERRARQTPPPLFFFFPTLDIVPKRGVLDLVSLQPN